MEDEEDERDEKIKWKKKKKDSSTLLTRYPVIMPTLNSPLPIPHRHTIFFMHTPLLPVDQITASTKMSSSFCPHCKHHHTPRTGTHANTRAKGPLPPYKREPIRKSALKNCQLKEVMIIWPVASARWNPQLISRMICIMTIHLADVTRCPTSQTKALVALHPSPGEVQGALF